MRWDGPKGARCSWFFPFWYEDSADTLVTPLYGQSRDSRWIFPLAYWDDDELVTPLWWQAVNRATGGLAWSSRDETFGGHAYAKRSLFWRLYHHEELNGDATTDVFPFITHDEKKDGHVETSFFWRLFRYENDPKAGTSLDLFFVPIKRP